MPELRGSARHAALCAAILHIAQEEPIDTAMFYDARMGVSIYGGMFDPMTQLPLPTYYSFMAFGELYRLGNECEVIKTDADGVYASAATDGKYGAVMITNTKEEDVDINLNMIGRILDVKVIKEGINLSPIGKKIPSVISKNSVLLINVEI